MFERTFSSEELDDDGHDDEEVEGEGEEDGEEVFAEIDEDLAAGFVDDGEDEGVNADGGESHDPVGEDDHDIVEGFEDVAEGVHFFFGESRHGDGEEDGEEDEAEHLAVAGGGGDDVLRDHAFEKAGELLPEWFFGRRTGIWRFRLCFWLIRQLRRRLVRRRRRFFRWLVHRRGRVG